MIELSDQDFCREPARLLDVVRLGRPAIITSAGEPALMAVPLCSPAIACDALVELATLLYARRHVSLAQAAQIAGMTPATMLDEMGWRGLAPSGSQADGVEQDRPESGQQGSCL